MAAARSEMRLLTGHQLIKPAVECGAGSVGARIGQRNRPGVPDQRLVTLLIGGEQWMAYTLPVGPGPGDDNPIGQDLG
jgi:hypothetical protein